MLKHNKPHYSDSLITVEPALYPDAEFTINFLVERPKHAHPNYGRILGVESFKPNTDTVNLQKAYDELYDNNYLQTHTIQTARTWHNFSKQEVTADNLAFLVGKKRFIQEDDLGGYVSHPVNTKYHEIWLHVRDKVLQPVFTSFNKEWYDVSDVVKHLIKGVGVLRCEVCKRRYHKNSSRGKFTYSKFWCRKHVDDCGDNTAWMW